MLLSFLRVLTLLLAALSLATEWAHVLELPQKLRYDAQMYTAVNGSLYRYFAIAGGVCQIGAIAAAFLLAFAIKRDRPVFTYTVAGALLLLAAFLAWLALVAPVNSQIAQALRLHPETVPALWTVLRNRWEYGHAAGFAIQLCGYLALLLSLITGISRHSRT